MALIGAVVIVGLTSNFLTTISTDDDIADVVAARVAVEVDGSVDFVATSDVEAALAETALPEETATALVEDYQEAQLQALRTGLFVAAVIALASLMFTRHLPGRRPDDDPPHATAGSTA